MQLSIIGYDPSGAWMRQAGTMEELLGYRSSGGITWINVNGLKDCGEALSRLSETYGVHPLTLEDILNTEHRPKVEEFDDYIFITFKLIKANSERRIEIEQVSIILTKDTVITFQESHGPFFEPIRRRILGNVGRIRKMGSDYLAYAIMDSVIDGYFVALDDIGTKIEDFEDRAILDNDASFIPDLQDMKQLLLKIRRIVWPLRENLSSLQRMETPLVNENLDPFLKDLYDNVLQAAETVETYRELLSGVLEVNMSAVSNRMNSVMKVLTIISTIFIPITFIVGVYGMNFSNMPELDYPYAYYVTWGVMFVIVIGMIVYFKRKKWI
ncbi:magnesium/cobalt transporter CorA [Breznakiella homolactica]|uniref:Magnesium transport protein CorA n=2 Tax=Breznakiella homolactica TaxID=2798577 RepID=A0A7T7XS39_9SPIR|nr:magnesium/cobalt transporter CorA [Breznakiella homolactica]